MASIKKCARNLANQRLSIEKFREKHSKVFAKLSEMEAEADHLEHELKEAAKAKAGQEEVTLHSDELITVMVKPTFNKQIYSVEKVRKYWGKYADKVIHTIVDNTAVEELVSHAKLDQKKLDKAADGPRELRSKKVYIRIAGVNA